MSMPRGYMLYQIDKEWLRQKYEDEELSTTDIAMLCKYSPRSISRLLDRFGIKKRTREEGVKTSRSREKRSSSMSGKMTFDKNPMYKGGYISGGYKKIGKRFYHRIIAEQVLERKLKKDEVVHHKNGNALDNCPENLVVMKRSEHVALHQREGGYRKGKKPWNYKKREVI